MAPKADNLTIAEHEAGKHDVYNGGYPTKGPQPGSCRLCAKRAKNEANAVGPVIPVVAGTVIDGAYGTPPITTNPKAKRVGPVGEPGPKAVSKLLVIAPPKRSRRPVTEGIHGVSQPVEEPRLPAPAVVARAKARRAAALKPAPVEPQVLVPAPASQAPAPIHPTREAWMLAAVEAMRPWFVEVGAEVGPVRISIGWAGGRSAKGKGIRGQCWSSHTVADGIPAIFVTPDQSDPLTIAGIILHEMDHAADDGNSGHRGAFAKTAKALGFIAPWTSSEGKTPELIERLTELLTELGEFPHGAITDRLHGLTGMGKPVPQTTRMLKVTCPVDGCLVRMTSKWLEEVGAPTCACGTEMVRDAS